MATVTAYRKCEICGMKSHKNNELKRYFMARFPLDEVRCKLWVKVTGNEDLAYVPIEKLHQLKFVCGKHFEDRDFNKKKTRLKKYAVPSIHLNAKPLADEILAEFPFHVSSFNLGENEPSTSKQVTATSNTSNVQNETDVNNKGVPMTVTSHIVINDTDVNVKESISESTGTGESFHASKIYYNDEIPVIDNTVEITTSDSVIQSSNSSTQQIIPQIDTQAIDAPIRKKKRASDAKSPKIRMKSNNPTLQLTPRKKRLIKRLNKYKMLLKQFRQKVKEVDKIKSPALKTFIKSAVQNQHRRPQGRRWSNDIKGLVLAIYKKSPKVYRYMKQLLPLPSERTLQTILQKVPMEPGWNEQLLNYLKKKAGNMNQKEKVCVLLFDEMSLKKRLIYNSRSDKIEGYQDLGSHGRTADIADKTLVFMLQGIYKKFKQPLAHYFVKGTISSEKLSVLIKEAVIKVSLAGYQIIATVCDQGPTNVGGLNLLKKFSGIPLEGNYFYVEGRKIFILYDVPHLFKSIRNNFMSAGLLVYDNKVAKWSHLREVAEKNTSTLHLKKITPLHVDPSYRTKMKVKLAAQILSNTVKAILLLLADTYRDEREDDGMLKRDALKQTASVVRDLDQLFDCTNGPASKKDIKTDIRENVCAKSNHHRLWIEYKNKIKTISFLKSDSFLRLSNVRCINGYYTTLCSLQDIWSVVHKMGFKYLNLRQLNQDSLENLFGLIRQHCPTNQNPTCHHFTAALKSTILTRLSTPLRGSNCEGDDNELMLDFHDLVFGNSAANDSLDNEHQYSSNFFEEVIDDNEDLLLFHLPEVPLIDNASKGYTYEAFEKQPLVYVSGYIAMAIIKRIKVICKDCSNCLKTNSKGDEDIYKYISLNEWKEGKKSLTYPTVALCSAVEAAVQVFEKEIRQNLYKADIGQYCRLMMLASIDSSWICAIHKNDILERLLQHISLLLIRSECKKINQSMNQKEQACADLLKKAQAQGIAK